MKKILSLFLVVAMFLTLSVTAFAKPEATGTANLNTIYTKTADGITVDVYVSNVTDVMEVKHQLNLATSKVTLVADSLVVNDSISGWDTKSVSQGPSKITLQVTTLDATKALNSTEEILLASYKLTVVDGVTLTKADFAYNEQTTSTAYLKKCYYMDSTSNEYYFASYEYDYKAAGWTETNSDGETITIKFPTQQSEVGNASALTGTTKPATSYVEFGKATTALEGVKVENGKITNADKSYFITYNGQKFYGLLDVEAGKSWAIVVVDTSAN